MAELPTSVLDARNKATELAGVAGDFTAKSYNIEDELKKVVKEALDYNKDVIALRSGALADYLASGPEAEAKYGVKEFTTGEKAGQTNPNFIFNPFERNATIADYQKGQEIPFLFANTLLGQREGTIADVVGAGTRAFQAKTAAEQAAAKAAQDTYQSVLNEFLSTQDLGLRERQTAVAEKDAETNRIQANKQGAGNASATDRYTALSTAMSNVANAAEKIKTAQNGQITQDQLKQLWDQQMPSLQTLGVPAPDIASAVNAMLAADEVVTALPAAPNIGAAIKPIINAAATNPLKGIINIPGLNPANIQRGISNVSSFIKGFQQ